MPGSPESRNLLSAERIRKLKPSAVVLNIGQELPADFEEAYAIVHADFRQARANPRLLFSYTGMDWRRQDRPRIRALHQRLDEAWAGGG